VKADRTAGFVAWGEATAAAASWTTGGKEAPGGGRSGEAGVFSTEPAAT
jgi:hypothetical protein